MKLLDLIKLSIESLLSSIKQLLMIIVLLSLGIFLTGVSVYMHDRCEFNTRICKDAIKRNADRISYIKINEIPEENEQSFVDELSKIEHIEHMGKYECFLQDNIIFKEIRNMQRQGVKNASFFEILNYGIDMPCVTAEYDLLQEFDIELMDGKEIECPKDEYVVHMYLGAKLTDIPIGTVYELPSGYYNESGELVSVTYKYEVKGYVEKGTKVWAGDIKNVDFESDYYYNMDYGVLEVESNQNNDDFGSNIYYSISDDAQYLDVVSDIKKIAMKYDADIRCGNFEDVFDRIYEKDREENENYIKLAIVVMFSVIMIQLCMQSTNILKATQKYGIYFANGFTKKDLYLMVVIENILRLLISLLITTVLTIMYLNHSFSMMPDLLARIFYEIKTFVVVDTLAISIFVVAAGTLLPMGIIAKMKPAMLIKELGD